MAVEKQVISVDSGILTCDFYVIGIPVFILSVF